MILPTFFVIGAPKAGTTSLHEYLAAHPEVAMTTEKEPNCFEPYFHWRERIHEYAELFDREAAVRGESSTAYSAYPWQADLPDRVHEMVPDARFVYLVREPVARTLSHYAQNVWDEKGQRPFEQVMDDLEGEWNMPVWCSRYATQLERWTSRFGADRVLVLDGRDLLTERAATMRRIFEFLEVDPSFTSPRWDELHNTAKAHRVPRPLARRLGPAAQAPGLRRVLTQEVPTPVPTAGQRERLRALLAPEVARLREMTGLAFDHWDL